MYYAIYDIKSGRLSHAVQCPTFLADSIELTPEQALASIDGSPPVEGEYAVVDGALIQIPAQPTPLAEQQEEAWENIKKRRLQAVTSGVYVELVDKWFHTDEVSVTSYSTIAGMIALDNYEPVQWKTMDNTWILLTIPIFKELQTAMSQKTNTNYAIAEQHKSNMMKSDNPLEYDFSTGWV